MKTESIASTLLRGSRNIDLMRSEIDCIVKLMIGQVTTYQVEYAELIPEWNKIKGLHGLWRLNRKITDRQSPRITYFINNEVSGESWVYSSEESDGLGRPPMESVQYIFEDLSSLVDGITSLFPGIKDFRWDAIVKASEVKID